MPNEVYHIGLSYGAIAVYGYLLYIENRQTYQSCAAYNTAGKAVKARKQRGKISKDEWNAALAQA